MALKVCFDKNKILFFSFSERCGWIPTHHDVPESLAREYRWIPGLSVTEMEILHGAYRTDNPNCKCLRSSVQGP